MFTWYFHHKRSKVRMIWWFSYLCYAVKKEFTFKCRFGSTLNWETLIVEAFLVVIWEICHHHERAAIVIFEMRPSVALPPMNSDLGKSLLLPAPLPFGRAPSQPRPRSPATPHSSGSRHCTDTARSKLSVLTSNCLYILTLQCQTLPTKSHQL